MGDDWDGGEPGAPRLGKKSDKIKIRTGESSESCPSQWKGHVGNVEGVRCDAFFGTGFDAFFDTGFTGPLPRSPHAPSTDSDMTRKIPRPVRSFRVASESSESCLEGFSIGD